MRLTMPILVFVTGMLAFCLTSCTREERVVVTKPVALFSVSTRSVQYGPKPWQQADLVLPKPFYEPVNRDAPVVVWLHGGGWAEGEREEVTPKADAFTQHTGIVGLNIDYKVGTPTSPCWPQARKDIERAIDFVLSDEVPSVTGPVYLYGYSAGGTLAVKYAIEHPGEIEAVMAVGAPVDFEAWSNVWTLANLEHGFGDDWESEDPSRMTDRSWPRMILMHGTNDRIVPMKMNRAIEEEVDSVRLVRIPGGDHMLEGRESFEFAEAIKLMLTPDLRAYPKQAEHSGQDRFSRQQSNS